MRVAILGRAGQDLLQSYAFYEIQSEGLSDYFLDSISSDLLEEEEINERR